jgi:2-C-methyl-D-erythritol 4-phosphate cytidylyltransferase
MVSDTAAVIVAAGQGRRMGGTNKALMRLNGQALLSYSIRAFRACDSIKRIVVVMNDYDVKRMQTEWSTSPTELGADLVVSGGAERWVSSRNGVDAVSEDHDYVLVHDAARPLIGSGDIENIISSIRQHGCALAAEPLADTLKECCGDTRVTSTVDRQHMWLAQTPQGASCKMMQEAFAAWDCDANGLPTDESMILENIGKQPQLVACSNPNFKLTTPTDLHVAEALLQCGTIK